MPAANATTPNPIDRQTPFTDSNGLLTQDGWWILFTIQNSAVAGAQGAQLGNIGLTPDNGIAIPDLSLSGPQGSFHISSSLAPVTIDNPIYTGGSVQPGSTITLYYDIDVVGKPPIQFQVSDNGGFVADVNNIAIIDVLNTRTTYVFGYDGQIWTLKSFQTGETTVPL